MQIWGSHGTRGCLAVLLAVAMTAIALGQPEDKIELRVVKYETLSDAINNLKGEVVVVDVWAYWCHPCKAEFPNLVRLHEKYAKDGMHAVSISLDFPADDAKVNAEVIKFLQSRGAKFTNFLLVGAEDNEFWQKKFHAYGPPLVFVFDREGHWTQFKGEKAYGDVEKLVRELLHSK
jgi:thiol-disulfide isomerase/thioredoxin